MFRGSGRSARGQMAESDPRFLQGGNTPVGLRGTQRGTRATLLGANPGQVVQVARPESLERDGWLVSISSVVTSPGGYFLTARAFGEFGAGGASHRFDVDIRPDAGFILPGSDINVRVGWAPVYIANPDGLTYREDFSNLPQQLAIETTAQPASLTVGGATRTYVYDATAQPGSSVSFPIPPFANDFMVLGVAADMIAFNIIDFPPSGTANSVDRYTLLETNVVRLTGNRIPLPPLADQVRLTIPGIAASKLYIVFGLSL